MKNDLQVGFGKITQTQVRDRILGRRIPDLLYAKADCGKEICQLCKMAADYIIELESLLVQHGVVKDEHP